MGNNTSSEEKIGGAFLTIFGLILAPTPIGAFTSTWMIPVGGGLMTGKEQNTGTGLTYADDGNNIKPFIGNPSSALYLREQQRNKIIEDKNKMIEFQENERKNLIESIKKNFPIDYAKCVDEFLGKKSNLYIYYPTIKTYKFNISGRFSSDNAFINNFSKIIESKKTLQNTIENTLTVDKIYVIRRKLSNLPIFAGWISHSGLLLKTKCGKYYICEYGVEKNAVVCYNVDAKNDDLKNQNETFENNKQIWHKQIVGTTLNGKITVENIKETMSDITCKKYYSILFWNCHMAQENTRKQLGLKVNLEYLNDDFRENLEFFNNMQ